MNITTRFTCLCLVQQTYKPELNSGEKCLGDTSFCALCSGPRRKNLSKQLRHRSPAVCLDCEAPRLPGESFPYTLPTKVRLSLQSLRQRRKNNSSMQKPRFEGQLQWRAAKIIALGGISTRSQQRLCLKMYLVVLSDQINEAVGFRQTGRKKNLKYISNATSACPNSAARCSAEVPNSSSAPRWLASKPQTIKSKTICNTGSHIRVPLMLP